MSNIKPLRRTRFGYSTRSVLARGFFSATGNWQLATGSSAAGRINGLASRQCIPGGIGRTMRSSRSDLLFVLLGNHHGVVAAPTRVLLDRCWIDDGDRQIFEIRNVESEQAGNAVTLHRGGEARIVRPKASDSQRFDQLVPSSEQVIAVGQQCEASLEEDEPLAALRGRQAQSVRRGHSRRDGPELVEVLWNDREFLSSSQKSVYRASGRSALRMPRACDSAKQIGVQKDHSPGCRV
jgi:hypothetical protein